MTPGSMSSAGELVSRVVDSSAVRELHLPADNVTVRERFLACCYLCSASVNEGPELMVYNPAAVQLVAEVHEIPSS